MALRLPRASTRALGRRERASDQIGFSQGSAPPGAANGPLHQPAAMPAADAHQPRLAAALLDLRARDVGGLLDGGGINGLGGATLRHVLGPALAAGSLARRPLAAAGSLARRPLAALPTRADAARLFPL